MISEATYFENLPDSWDVKSLGEVFERVKRKNTDNCEIPLTISAQLGLVNQKDYFTKRVASEDLSGYYLLKNGEFAYNKSYSSDYPWGAIKRLDNYEEGAVSTLYVCFSLRSIEESCSDYFIQFFESGIFDNEISTIAQEGARNHGLLNVPVDEFFDLLIPVPPKNVQQSISDKLLKIDNVIQKQVDKVKKLKALFQAIIEDIMNYGFVNTEECKTKGVIPEGWDLVTLEECTVELKNKNNGQYEKDRAFGVSNKLGIIPMKPNLVPASIDKYKVIEKYSFAYNPMRLNVGSIGFWKEDRAVVVSPDYVTFKADTDKVLPEYLNYFRRTPSWRKFVKAAGKGGVRVRIYYSNLGELEIPLPPIEVQKEIIEKISKTEDIIISNINYLNKLKAMKKGVAKKLFSGE